MVLVQIVLHELVLLCQPERVIFCIYYSLIIKYVNLSVLVDHGFKKHIASPCAYVCELPS